MGAKQWLGTCEIVENIKGRDSYKIQITDGDIIKRHNRFIMEEPATDQEVTELLTQWRSPAGLIEEVNPVTPEPVPRRMTRSRTNKNPSAQGAARAGAAGAS